MPGKHAARQGRALRPRLTFPAATSVGAHRSPGGGSQVGRGSSLAAIGLTGTLALTLGGVAVGDEDQPTISRDDVAVLPGTSNGSSTVGFMDPLRRVSETLEAAEVNGEEGAAEPAEVYRPRHRAESTEAAPGSRDQAGSHGTGTNGTPDGDTSSAGDEPGTARSATDAVVDTVRKAADPAPDQSDPVVDPVVEAADESLSGAADIVDGLLP